MTRAAPRSEALLRRLQRRLSVLFLAAAVAGLATFVAVLGRLDSGYSAQRQVIDLKAQASRAAALMYVDDGGAPQTDGVLDDMVADGPGALVVVRAPAAGERSMTVLLATDGVQPDAVLPLARAALGDGAEEGTTARVSEGGRPAAAVAMPWFGDRGVAGAVVTVAPLGARVSSRLLTPAIGVMAAVLLAVVLIGLWVIARSMRPAIAALADRERFLATAAHELRAPLARLRAGAEAVRRTADVPDATARALDRLVDVADGAGHVVANLLLATRIEHSEVPIRVAPVRLDVLAGDLETAYGCVVDVDRPVTVDADAGLLRHALVNLVENAQRHGRVAQISPEVLLRVVPDAGGVTVQVVDDGPGFPPDVDVLSRYVSGHTAGTGLGLPLVEWIVGRHGGTLRLENRGPDRSGAVVTIRLPYRTGPRTGSRPGTAGLPVRTD